LLALLGARYIFQVSGLRVNSTVTKTVSILKNLHYRKIEKERKKKENNYK
jgi:hypothetical protein